MFIGLTGSIASGKEIVADYLMEKGFVYLSLSNELREIAQKKKVLLTRKNLQDLGNELRKKEGPVFLAKRIFDKIKNQQYKKVVIDSIRNPAEIRFLEKNLKNFFLVSVDAPEKIRFERLLLRDRESDPKTFTGFLQMDARDKGEGEPKDGQQVGKCMVLAKFNLINDKSLEEGKKKVEKLYYDLLDKIPRPSWDEYFLEIANAVSKRATCNRGRAGTVIVKNKQILATGYVGAPAGLPHCDEAGHLLKTTIHEDGRKSTHCLRTVHSEQNAISQAAKRGVAIEGATIYTKMTPCTACCMSIINSGIKRVVCGKRYHNSKDSEKLLKDAKIKLDYVSTEVEKYKNQ